MFLITKNTDYLSLSASLAGAIPLIFVAKGNVLGPVISVVFCIIYAIISFKFRYYGEMITWLVALPINLGAIVTWLKNPHNGNKSEVKINTLSRFEFLIMFVAGIFVTVGFYFILKYLGTESLLISTISVLTSFLAGYLTIRRSEFYALAFAANDVILVVLWTIATFQNLNYLSMVICFVVFLVNDIYGFLCWSKNRKKQSAFFN
jgi:nicotinamide mononucleotide transporter PnuC